jgi:hypothetical protein
LAIDHVQEQKIEAMEQMIRQRNEVDAAVRSNIEAASRYNATYADQHRRDVVFAVGDQVLLNTKHLPL